MGLKCLACLIKFLAVIKFLADNSLLLYCEVQSVSCSLTERIIMYLWTCAPSKESDQTADSLPGAVWIAKDTKFLHADKDDWLDCMDVQSGPCCSKLTTSLVNDSLKFTSIDTVQKLLTFFQQKISEYCI